MADLKYRYIGGPQGTDYLFNIAPSDITVEAWEALPRTIQEAVIEHPKIYELVPAPTEADQIGPVTTAPSEAP